jgi:hypothetical protein
MFVPHDLLQALYGGPQVPSGSTVGNGNTAFWPIPGQGKNEYTDPNAPANASAYAALVNWVSNVLSDCGPNL